MDTKDYQAQYDAIALASLEFEYANRSYLRAVGYLQRVNDEGTFDKINIQARWAWGSSMDGSEELCRAMSQIIGERRSALFQEALEVLRVRRDEAFQKLKKLCTTRMT